MQVNNEEDRDMMGYSFFAFCLFPCSLLQARVEHSNLKWILKFIVHCRYYVCRLINFSKKASWNNNKLDEEGGKGVGFIGITYKNLMFFVVSFLKD